MQHTDAYLILSDIPQNTLLSSCFHSSFIVSEIPNHFTIKNLVGVCNCANQPSEWFICANAHTDHPKIPAIPAIRTKMGILHHLNTKDVIPQSLSHSLSSSKYADIEDLGWIFFKKNVGVRKCSCHPCAHLRTPTFFLLLCGWSHKQQQGIYRQLTIELNC